MAARPEIPEKMGIFLPEKAVDIRPAHFLHFLNYPCISPILWAGEAVREVPAPQSSVGIEPQFPPGNPCRLQPLSLLGMLLIPTAKPVLNLTLT